jgi:hypothetical protein
MQGKLAVRRVNRKSIGVFVSLLGLLSLPANSIVLEHL